jgi:hypothetical protein
MMLADIIYPAFLHPYALQLYMPFIAVAAFATEVVVYGAAYGRVGFFTLSATVLGANLISSLTGVGFALILPSGLNKEFVRHLTGPAQGPNWYALATASWLVAVLVSIAIEYPVVKILTRRRVLPHLFRVVCIANAASYLVLFGTAWVRPWLLWS